MTPSAQTPVMAVMQADLQDSDVATAQTVRLMCSHIHRAAKDPLVKQTAHQAETMWGSMRPSSRIAGRLGLGDASPGPGCFWWAKHYVKAVPHSQFKAALRAVYPGMPTYPDKRQLLEPPNVLLQETDPKGDCSTFTMLLAAMLEALGVSWELVTVAVEPEDPTLYSHVFVRVVLENGSRLTLDGSHGAYPGWEVPRAHQFRRQVWDASGEPISDEAVQSSALGEYRGRGVDCCGLGQDTTDLSGYLSEIGGSPSYNVPAAAPAVASGPSWFESLVGNLANQWTQIGSRVIAPTTTISSGPSGTQIVTPGGGSVPSSLLTAATGTSLGLGSSGIWWLAGGLLAAVVLMKSLGKK